MKRRVFSGARPTGRQHLGNYCGAIRNYVALQEEYECVYCVVDLHALTTLQDTDKLRDWTYEMALDWLASGMYPDRGTVVFVQSHVPQVTELHTMLSMATPLGWVLLQWRCPRARTLPCAGRCLKLARRSQMP